MDSIQQQLAKLNLVKEVPGKGIRPNVTVSGASLGSNNSSTSQKKSTTKGGPPSSDCFTTEQGDKHTRIASAIAEVIVGKKTSVIELPNSEEVIHFAVRVGSVFVNFFGYGEFRHLSSGEEVTAKVEIWEKIVKGRTFAYINFYPTDTGRPNKQLVFHKKASGSKVVSFIDIS